MNREPGPNQTFGQNPPFGNLEFRWGTPNDAPRIAGLIRDLAPWILGPEPQDDSKGFWESVSVEAEASYLADPRYSFLLAVDGETLAGLVAMRDQSHLFHLFVARSHQGLGLATFLWEQIKRELLGAGYRGPITVNSTLGAVGFYQKQGFVRVGPVVKASGIAFQPMEFSGQIGM